ncbi:sensor histidine kinase [Streptosporangium sp. NPDC004379]|uniref:sensor histidine kinase n=1 Tax=Streptosporangium sp. NPDC004379 TaxID=3366189 RepID=UPI0036B45E01
MGRSRMRAVAVDAGIGAAVAAVNAVAISADVGGETAPPVTAYLFAVTFGALMFARRRFPVAVLLVTAAGLVAYYVLRFPPVGLALPLAGALYSAAEDGRWRWAAGTAAAVTALSTFFRFREGDDPAYLFGLELASTVALMVAMIALGDGIRARRLLRAEIRDREARAAAERERAAALRAEEERLRIARELHDVLAHTVTVISVQAAVAAEALEDDPPAAATALGVIREAGGEAMRELRATLGLLRGDSGDGRDGGTDGNGVLAPVGGLAQLDRLVRTAGDSGLPVRLRIAGEPVDLPRVIDTAAYRVVQEALTNVLRHAGAASAEVLVRYGAELVITVTDDGRGATGHGSRPGEGRGLLGMAERVAVLGGALRTGNGPDGGFRVAVTLPLAPRGRIGADAAGAAR